MLSSATSLSPWTDLGFGLKAHSLGNLNMIILFQNPGKPIAVEECDAIKDEENLLEILFDCTEHSQL